MLFKKEITLNMPQMAVEALSENWLFKELGSIHWDLICEGLKTKSFDLKDDLDNRLYATFIRIKMHCSTSLFDYKENENICLTANIKRFGNSLYHSNIIVEGENKHIKAELLTSFSIRNDSDNINLAKSQPINTENSILEYDSNPTISEEYRLIKKGSLNIIQHEDAIFIINNEIIFETNYKINPYYDINGVGLLYFAAYPIINDYCEAQFFNNENDLQFRWEQKYYTKSKDIFYFANCNINDEIIYKLHSFEYLNQNLIKLNSSLVRKSDNTLLARIFSIKMNSNID